MRYTQRPGVWMTPRPTASCAAGHAAQRGERAVHQQHPALPHPGRPDLGGQRIARLLSGNNFGHLRARPAAEADGGGDEPRRGGGGGQGPVHWIAGQHHH